VSANGNTGAVCRECALAAGFVPKNKAVGVWVDECALCGERKPCTDLVHDWTRKRLPASAGGSAEGRKGEGDEQK